jgi:hypothetical protein
VDDHFSQSKEWWPRRASSPVPPRHGWDLLETVRRWSPRLSAMLSHADHLPLFFMAEELLSADIGHQIEDLFSHWHDFPAAWKFGAADNLARELIGRLTEPGSCYELRFDRGLQEGFGALDDVHRRLLDWHNLNISASTALISGRGVLVRVFWVPETSSAFPFDAEGEGIGGDLRIVDGLELVHEAGPSEVVASGGARSAESQTNSHAKVSLAVTVMREAYKRLVDAGKITVTTSPARRYQLVRDSAEVAAHIQRAQDRRGLGDDTFDRRVLKPDWPQKPTLA